MYFQKNDLTQKCRKTGFSKIIIKLADICNLKVD
jgi:hypothetical protein